MGKEAIDRLREKARNENTVFALSEANRLLRAKAETLRRERDELLAALEKMNRAYVNLMENGRDRIIMLGGDCDPVDVMERDDPNLRESRATIAKVKP